MLDEMASGPEVVRIPFWFSEPTTRFKSHQARLFRLGRRTNLLHQRRERISLPLRQLVYFFIALEARMTMPTMPISGRIRIANSGISEYVEVLWSQMSSVPDAPSPMTAQTSIVTEPESGAVH